MNYEEYRASRRAKSAITLFGYTRHLSRNSIYTLRTRNENHDALNHLFNTIRNELNTLFSQSSVIPLTKSIANNLLVTSSTPSSSLLLFDQLSINSKIPSMNAKRAQTSRYTFNKYQNIFIVELNFDGECGLALSKYNPNSKSLLTSNHNISKIDNHLGNHEALLFLKKTIEKPEYINETNDDDDDNNNNDYNPKEKLVYINGFLELIKFCFKYLGKSGDDIDEAVESEFFQIVGKHPIEVTIEHSMRKYSIEEILSKYFKYIAYSAQKNTKVECKKFVFTIPANYGILEKTELKKCIDNAGLELLRLLSKPMAKVLSTIPEKPMRKGQTIKAILIDFNSGPLSITLYEIDSDKNVQILSSLIETRLTTQLLYELARDLFNKNISNSMESFQNSVEDDTRLESYANEIDQQLHNGINPAVLNLDNKIKVFRNDIDTLLKSFTNQAYRLIDAILLEYNLTLNDILRINYCTQLFTHSMADLIKKAFKSQNSTFFYGTKDFSSLEGVTLLAKRLAMTGYDCIENSLGCNLGIGEFRGIFVKQLTRGSKLPCSNSVILNTVIDYQESCVIEIYQGERPFSRYCNLLGTLSIHDLPLDKAYKIEIEVVLSIDRDEILTVKAHELKTNTKLSVIIEKGKMKNDNSIHMVLDALDNKEDDDKLIEKLDHINYLIEEARKQYENTEYEAIVFDKMNYFVTWLTDRKKTINLDECETCIKAIHKYFVEENLEFNV